MTIVHAGTLTVQVGGEGTRREYVEGLIAQIEGSVRRVAARCIEEAVEAEVTTLHLPLERALGGA
jgi:hypothetical protein